MSTKRVQTICYSILFMLGLASTANSIAQNDNTLDAARKRYGTGLGRLLTSEPERVKLDNQRFNTPAPAPVTPKAVEVRPEAPVLLAPPERWRIDGISNRPSRPQGQRISVWIDGQVYGESELPKGMSLVRNVEGEVIGMNSVVAKGKTEFAKIGDLITRPQTAEEAKAIEQAAELAKNPPPPEKPVEKDAEKPSDKSTAKTVAKP